MNRVHTENRIGAIQSTVYNDSFKVGTIAPPSSTRGGADRREWSQQTRMNLDN